MPGKTEQHWVRAEEEARATPATRGSVIRRHGVAPEEEARHRAPDTGPVVEDPWERREEAGRRDPLGGVPPPNPD